MEQDPLPFLVVLAAIFAAMLALAALFVPAEATAPGASVEGSADQGTATHTAAGPDVGDGNTGAGVGTYHRRAGRPSRGPMVATGYRT